VRYVRREFPSQILAFFLLCDIRDDNDRAGNLVIPEYRIRIDIIKRPLTGQIYSLWIPWIAFLIQSINSSDRLISNTCFPSTDSSTSNKVEILRLCERTISFLSTTRKPSCMFSVISANSFFLCLQLCHRLLNLLVLDAVFYG